MRNRLVWILFLALVCEAVRARPQPPPSAPQREDQPNEQVISVRITSSVAVGRGKKLSRSHQHRHNTSPSLPSTSPTKPTSIQTTKLQETKASTTENPMLAGANMEYLKKLNSKKEARGLQHFESIHMYPSSVVNFYNETEDSVAESSDKSEVETKDGVIGESIDNIPLARSVPLSPSSKNYIQGETYKPLSERGNSARLTTVSFNIVHEAAKVTSNYNNDPSDTFTKQPQRAPDPPKYFNEPPKFYNEPAKVYSQPAQVYSEPAKFYSEPAKVYGEPAKIYSEPAKIYSEPAKIYSEPAKFYSEPASLHLPPVRPSYSPWQPPAHRSSSTTVTTTPTTTVNLPVRTGSNHEHLPEKNYEVDEKISVLTDGRSHGVQESSENKSECKQENCKVGYVVEGRQYRKYRVEERTADGFIVGEYGVVRNEDGALRGVRYTADGDASPRLIYDALMKFLQLK